MRFLSMAALLLAVSPAWAQLGGAGAPPTMSGWSHAMGSGGALHPHRAFPRNSSAIALGEAWLETYTAPPGQATYMVLQPPAPLAPPSEPAKPVSPLLIEWHGDRFVRTHDLNNNPEPNVEPLLRNSSAAPRAQTGDAQPKPENRQTIPLTLIFRDGHQEKVEDYSIVGGRLYTSADYAQTGKWIKTISLSTLNLAATIETNRQSGTTFILPKSPNEVIASF